MIILGLELKPLPSRERLLLRQRFEFDRMMNLFATEKYKNRGKIKVGVIDESKTLFLNSFGSDRRGIWFYSW